MLPPVSSLTGPIAPAWQWALQVSHGGEGRDHSGACSAQCGACVKLTVRLCLIDLDGGLGVLVCFNIFRWLLLPSLVAALGLLNLFPAETR